MITKKELQDYARLKGLNLGNDEKDYLIDIALLSISNRIKNELVFKGGTCLYKFHKLNRFSEDIDFSASFDVDLDVLSSHIALDFERFGIKAVIHKKKDFHNSILITFKIEGPLFSGKDVSCATLGMDVNLKSPVILEPEFLTYNSLYPDISRVSALCMRKEEIFAEKIRAIITRNRARDLFDLYFLIEEGASADESLVNKKMEYYDTKFDINELVKKVKAFEKSWEKELASFASSIPKFGVVSKKVIYMLKNNYLHKK